VHELALCGAIADIATRKAGERRVSAVHVRIGRMRQVVPETLTFCWDMVVSGTELDGCLLEVERVPAVLRCGSCGVERPMGPVIAFACSSCGSLDVTALSGDEFDVTALELARS
jgi:hydrogenase nickel incorporation protein HypA/HybF